MSDSLWTRLRPTLIAAALGISGFLVSPVCFAQDAAAPLQLQKRLQQQTLPLLQHFLRILLERIPILLRRSGLMLVVELQGIGLLPRPVR